MNGLSEDIPKQYGKIHPVNIQKANWKMAMGIVDLPINIYSSAIATGSCTKADRVSIDVQDQTALREWQLAMGVWRDVSSSDSDDDLVLTEDTMGDFSHTYHAPRLFFWDYSILASPVA